MMEQSHLRQAKITDYGFKVVGCDWSLPVAGSLRPGGRGGGVQHLLPVVHERPAAGSLRPGGRGGGAAAGRLLSGLQRGGAGMARVARWVRTRVSWGGRAGAKRGGGERALEILEAGRQHQADHAAPPCSQVPVGPPDMVRCAAGRTAVVLRMP